MASDKKQNTFKQPEQSTLRQLEQILAKKQKYIVKIDKRRRDIDAVNGTVGDLFVAFGTLIKDLQEQGILEE